MSVSRWCYYIETSYEWKKYTQQVAIFSFCVLLCWEFRCSSSFRTTFIDNTSIITSYLFSESTTCFDQLMINTIWLFFIDTDILVKSMPRKSIYSSESWNLHFLCNIQTILQVGYRKSSWRHGHSGPRVLYMGWHICWNANCFYLRVK
jgi:hypothetical protein